MLPVRALWPSRHELAEFRTDQAFVGGRNIPLSRSEFEIDGEGIVLNLLHPFPTDFSPPSLLETAGQSRVTEFPKVRGRLLKILDCEYGCGDLAPAESAQGGLETQWLTLANTEKKASLPNTSLAASDPA